VTFHRVSPEEGLGTLWALPLPHHLVLRHQVQVQVLPLGEGFMTASAFMVIQFPMSFDFYQLLLNLLWLNLLLLLKLLLLLLKLLLLLLKLLLLKPLLFGRLSMNLFNVPLQVVVREVLLGAVPANELLFTPVNNTLVIFEIFSSAECFIASGTLLQLGVDVSSFDVDIEVASPEESLVALDADEVALFQMNFPEVDLQQRLPL